RRLGLLHRVGLGRGSLDARGEARCSRATPNRAARRRYRVELATLAGRLLGRRRGERAQVVRGLQATHPGELVGFIQLFTGGAGHVDVEALRLVDPFLTARSRLDDPRGVDLERGRVELAQVRRNAIDLGERAVEVFQVRDHHL